MKPDAYTPSRSEFEKGLGQKFRQAPGTGVTFSKFGKKELLKGGEDNIFPLVIRMETLPKSPPADEPPRESLPLGAPLPDWVHAQITQAILEKKDDDAYQVRVVKQIIWVAGVRYELQEIYGIDSSGISGNYDGTDAGKECVVCMSEPRDTTVLPCRHMVRPLVPIFILFDLITLTGKVCNFLRFPLANNLSFMKNFIVFCSIAEKNDSKPSPCSMWKPSSPSFSFTSIFTFLSRVGAIYMVLTYATVASVIMPQDSRRLSASC